MVILGDFEDHFFLVVKTGKQNGRRKKNNGWLTRRGLIIYILYYSWYYPLL